MFIRLASWLFLIPTFAFGWCHTTQIEHFYPAALIDDVIEDSTIHYCIQIDHPRFDHKSILLQLQSAIKLWLDAAGKEVKLIHQKCEDPNLDLKLHIGQERQYKNLGSYSLYTNHGHSLLKINSEYYWEKEHPYRDLKSFFTDIELDDLIYEISIQNPVTAYNLANKHGINRFAMRYNTYSAIIHELGHAFGLTDTAGPSRYCSATYRTKKQPPSVMRDSGSFYLFEDDIDGIRSLFKRFE